MARLPQKTPFGCPGCGFVQLEPPHLISTYCRSCGDYYEVGRPGSKKAPVLLPPLAGHREVHCHRCKNSHLVSAHARSTLCPSCNAAIELEDISFFLPTSRTVDTRGKLTIGPAGSLSSTWIICGSAHIAGNIVGLLRSEGEVRLATNHRCACQITAPMVVIEKNARSSFTLPVETDHLVVWGHLTGIIHCHGIIHVRRGGRLEADVHARSVTVEKGGALLGTCHVNVTQPEESEKKNPVPSDPPWSARLCPV